MSPRFINWIWHIRGSLALAPGQTSDDVFDRLDPLFQQAGTSRDRANDTLTFQKKDQAAQDKMSVFDGGVLRIEKSVAGPVPKPVIAPVQTSPFERHTIKSSTSRLPQLTLSPQPFVIVSASLKRTFTATSLDVSVFTIWK